MQKSFIQAIEHIRIQPTWKWSLCLSVSFLEEKVASILDEMLKIFLT